MKSKINPSEKGDLRRHWLYWLPPKEERVDSKTGGGRKGGRRWEKEGREVGGRGREVGDSGAGSGKGEICEMGEN